MFNGKSVLVTGGTGSFGKKFIQTLLADYPQVKRIVVFSRDELKQFDMAQQYPPQKYPQMRYFIGDVRDMGRLRRAMEGVDTVVHAAALKQVPAAEYNPFECIKTNIIGGQNVIEACLDANVEKVVALSTDKAAAPVNLYGATKLCSDKLFTAAHNMKGERNIKFAVVRYGNVMGSRGSVIPFFQQKKHEGVLPITDKRMTRFNILLQDGVNLVLTALKKMQGGEIFVPKIPSYRITDLAQAIAPECRLEDVGIRPGEKLHEEMITAMDSLTTVECPEGYVILPSTRQDWVDDYATYCGGRRVAEGFSYNSGQNERFLSVQELQDLVRQHCSAQ